MVFRQLNLQSRQRGQSSVFVVIFLGVLLLALISLYKSGKLTSEKMQLQNAADAAAYSVSVVEARDLNFMSYTNRAMVANEVAIAQMVGLVSWAQFLQSMSGWMRFYEKTFLAGPTLGISTGVVEPIAAGWDVVMSVLGSVMRTLGATATKILHVMNRIYGIAQYGFHLTSVWFMVTTLLDTIETNSPPRYSADGSTKLADGARLSEMGIVSLIGHIISYYGGAIPGFAVPSISFTKTYFPNKPADGVGFERFAAITGEARDPFSRERGKTRRIWPPHDLTSGWTLDIIPPIHVRQTLDLVLVLVTINFDLELNVNRKGGTELRHIKGPASVAAGAGGATKRRGDEFNWSAGDRLSLDLLFGAGIAVRDPIFKESIGHISFEISQEAGGFVFSASLAGMDITDILNLPTIPFPTGGPMGSGGAQAGSSPITLAKILEVTPNTLPGGKVEPHRYGTAPASLLSWITVPPLPPAAANLIPPNNIAPTYKGLPMYTDTLQPAVNPGFLAPYFLVGVIKDLDDVQATGPDYSSGDLQELRTEYDAANNRIASIAKSEVYFKRPLDLGYFARLDGNEELGSAFNPFWQARLVDTSWADRIMSLLLQQKADFLELGDIFGDISAPELPSF